MLNSLVRQLLSEGGPARIKDGLRHTCFRKCGGVYIAHGNIVKLTNDAIREFVMEIISAIGNLRVDRSNAPLLIRPLCNSQHVLSAAIDALCLNLLTGRQCDEIFQAKVDSDAVLWSSCFNRNNLNIDNDIEKPVAARVTREVCAVFDFSAWQWAAIENTERFTGKTESVSFSFQLPAFDWNPSKSTPAAIAQIRAIFLRARLRVLLTYRVDRTGMQAKFFTASSSELVQVESGQPWTAEAKRIFLSVVAVVPNKVARFGLPVKQTIKRFHSVTIDGNHICFVKKSAMQRLIKLNTSTSDFQEVHENQRFFHLIRMLFLALCTHVIRILTARKASLWFALPSYTTLSGTVFKEQK